MPTYYVRLVLPKRIEQMETVLNICLSNEKRFSWDNQLLSITSCSDLINGCMMINEETRSDLVPGDPIVTFVLKQVLFSGLDGKFFVYRSSVPEE